MKNNIFTLTLFLVHFCYFSLNTQSQIDPDWQERYWKTRLNFQNNFCVIGDDHGQSMPFNRDPTPWRPCENPEYASGKPTYVGKLHAGDATIRLGYYIASLALEYENLRLHNQNTDRTLKELYFAVLAVERLDKYAEYYVSYNNPAFDPTNNPNTLNGYFVRDDFEADFWSDYDHQKANIFREENEWGEHLQWGHNPMQQKRYIATDNNLACGNGAQSGTANQFNPNNQPSQDQLLGLLIGFATVRRMNVDVTFSPGPAYAAINILDKSVEITKRMMGALTSLKTYYVSENLKYSMNYFFRHPITGTFPHWDGKPAGSAYFILGYAFCKAANYIIGDHDYYSVPFIIKREDKNMWGVWETRVELINFEDETGNINQLNGGEIMFAFQTMDPYNLQWFNDGNQYWFGVIEMATNSGLVYAGGALWDGYFHGLIKKSLYDLWKDKIWGDFWNSNHTEVNLRLFLGLGAILPDHIVERQKMHEYSYVRGYQFYSLLYDVFNDDGNPIYSTYEDKWAGPNSTGMQLEFTASSKTRWESLLDGYPCSGPGWFPVNSQAPFLPNGFCPTDPSWAGSNIIIEETPQSCSNLQSGYFSGVDYMFLYNLYHFRFGGSDKYADEKGCNCEGYDDPIDQSGTITADYTLNRKQNGDTWNDFGFELYEYTSGNKTFGTYDLSINSGLILCKGLFTFSGGVINVGSSTEVGNFVIQNGGTLDLTNTPLNVNPGSTLTVKPGGTLILSDGTNLLVQGKVIIELGGILLLKGGQTTFAGNGDLVIRGGVSLESISTYTWNPTGSGNIHFEFGNYINSSPTLNSIKFYQSGVKIWVEDNVPLQFPPSLEKVEFDGTTIYLGEDSYVSFLTKAGVSNCEVTQWPGSALQFSHNGLIFWGADGLDPRDNRPLVYNTTFSNGKYGIQSFQNFFAKKSIIVSGCQFTDIHTAISITHGGGYIFGNTFNEAPYGNMPVGILSTHGSNFLNVESNRFGMLDAVEMSGSHGNRGIFAGNVFDNSLVGISASQGNIGLKCNYFVDNWYSVSSYNRNVLNASRDMNMLPTFVGIGAGDNAIVSLTYDKAGLTPSRTAVMNIKNGLNFFNHSLQNSRHITSTNLLRPQSIPSSFLAIDYDFGQNLWANYTSPATPANPNLLFVSDIDDQFDYAHPVRISSNQNQPINAIGTVATSTLTCQIPEWSGAYNPATFIPGSFNGLLFKQQPVSGILDPYGDFTGGTYGSGPLAGQTYRGALNVVYTGVTEVKYDRVTISTESFTQFGLVLQNSFSFDENYDVTTAALSDYLNFGQNLLEINEGNPSVQQQVFNEIQTTLLAEQSWLSSTNITNTEFFNEMMTLNEINLAYLYRGIEDYPGAFAHLSNATAFGSESQDIWIESIECYFQIERDLKEGVLERDIFLHTNDSCNAIKDLADALHELGLPYSTNQEGQQTDFVTVSISPNPVTSDLQFTISNLSEVQQNVVVTIYDKFGIVRGTMTVDQLPGNENYSLPLANAVNDVYSLVYMNNNNLRSIQFILNR